MAKRSHSRRPKINRNYTVDEAARLLGRHKQTLRNWIKDGLPIVDGPGITLILGCELHEYLAKRARAAKRHCGPGLIYCMRCKEPRRPAGGELEFKPRTPAAGDITALCEVCLALMYRRTRTSDLEAFRAAVVKHTDGRESSLSKMAPASVNIDS